MKDFVHEYGKLAGLTALGAFVLSLLVGLISANPFGTAVARALLFAVLFAAFAGAARLTVKKYLPEVFGSEPARDKTANGQNIDITLGEEPSTSEARSFARSRPSSSVGARTSPESDESPAEAERNAGASLQDEPADAAELADRRADKDLEDGLPPLTDADMASDIGTSEGGVPEPLEETVEEAESVAQLVDGFF